MKSFLTRLLLAVLVAAALSVAAAPTADAADGDTNTVCSSKTYTDPKYLPMKRWMSGTDGFDTRFDLNGIAIIAAGNLFQRNMQGVAFAGGNSFYDLTGAAVSWAANFCPLQSLGGTIDSASVAVTDAVISSGIAAGLVVIVILGLVCSSLRRGEPLAPQLNKVFLKLIIVGILVAMSAGAKSSTGAGIDGSDADYSPGTLSPGWFALTIDDAITSAATSPAAALAVSCSSDEADAATSGCGISADDMTGDAITCGPYRKQLNALYLESADRRGVLPNKYLPEMVVSNMWQQTGLRAYTVAQYGDGNTISWDNVVCHQLDMRSNVVVAGKWALDGTPDGEGTDLVNSLGSISSVLGEAAGLDNEDARTKLENVTRAPAWRAGINPNEQDKALVAWGVCRPPDGSLATVTDKEGWGTYDKITSQLLEPDGLRKTATEAGDINNIENGEFDQACFDFFNTDKEPSKVFDWGLGSQKMNDKDDLNPAAKSFLVALHGDFVPGAPTAVIAHFIGGLCALLSFGLLAIIQILVKLLMVVMLFFVFFIMLMLLLPGTDTSKLGRYVKQYIGLSLYSAFTLLLLSIVVLFSSVIMSVVASNGGGPMSITSMFAAAFSPILSMIGIHFIVKRIGLPSPMTLKGGMAWGSALAGGAGAAALMTGAGALQDKVQNIGSRSGRALTRATGNKIADKTYRPAMDKIGLGKGAQKAAPKGQMGTDKTTRSDTPDNTPDASVGTPSPTYGRTLAPADADGHQQSWQDWRNEQDEAKRHAGLTPGSDKRKALGASAKEAATNADTGMMIRQVVDGRDPRTAGARLERAAGRTAARGAALAGGIGAGAKNGIKKGFGAIGSGIKSIPTRIGEQYKEFSAASLGGKARKVGKLAMYGTAAAAGLALAPAVLPIAGAISGAAASAGGAAAATGGLKAIRAVKRHRRHVAEQGTAQQRRVNTLRNHQAEQRRLETEKTAAKNDHAADSSAKQQQPTNAGDADTQNSKPSDTEQPAAVETDLASSKASEPVVWSDSSPAVEASAATRSTETSDQEPAGSGQRRSFADYRDRPDPFRRDERGE